MQIEVHEDKLMSTLIWNHYGEERSWTVPTTLAEEVIDSINDEVILG